MISDEQASDIASAWHSVNTWSDPGVVMYSVTSTGKVHSEDHRRRLIHYIDSCMPAAVDADECARRAGDDPEAIVCESNVADLEALREWALAYPVNPTEEQTP